MDARETPAEKEPPDFSNVGLQNIADRLHGLSEITKALYQGYDGWGAPPSLDPARMFNALSGALSDLADQLEEEM